MLIRGNVLLVQWFGPVGNPIPAGHSFALAQPGRHAVSSIRIWVDRNGSPGVQRRARSFLWTAGRRLSTARGWLARVVVGIGCTTHPGGAGGPVGCRSWLLGWVPHWVRGRGSMEDGRRPRASAWQIAGVWIAAAALLLTAARMGLDLWQMAGH